MLTVVEDWEGDFEIALEAPASEEECSDSVAGVFDEGVDEVHQFWGLVCEGFQLLLFFLPKLRDDALAQLVPEVSLLAFALTFFLVPDSRGFDGLWSVDADSEIDRAIRATSDLKSPNEG